MSNELASILEIQWVETGLLLTGLVVAGLFANFVVKRLLLKALNKLLANTSFGKDAELRKHGVIPRLANIMPALVISAGLALIPGIPAQIREIGQNLSQAFIILTLAFALGGIVAIFDTIYHRRPEGRLKPIKSYLQIAKIAITAIGAILVIAALIDKSPVILLSGLGAMAAVLLLVFQDTLLSLVAGIQISSNDMVRVGDWISMPELNADGDVIEVALHTIKVQNWDKTITTIPIRRLVTDSFQNWRGMQESGGRRIKRSVHIDQNSIRFLTDDEIIRLTGVNLLNVYLSDKQQALTSSNSDHIALARHPANERRLTNIGTFRAYLESYLRSHPDVHQTMTLLVRQKDPARSGLPLEIYCFTNTTEWSRYESIQSDIFDHILAALPFFDLRIFQDVSGQDLNKACEM